MRFENKIQVNSLLVTNTFSVSYSILGVCSEITNTIIYMVISYEMDSLLKLIFSNPNGIFTCYSMHPYRQSIKVMNDNLHS